MKAVKINRENYALFAVDYIDGSLNSVQAAAFLSFLDENPDLKEEFNGLSLTNSLPADEMEMPMKQALKHDYDLDALKISLYNYDYYFIAWFEGDLTEPGRHNVSSFAKRHPEAKTDFERFAQSRLLLETDTIYPAKVSLKQNIILPLWMKIVPVAAFAATILLLISIYLRVEPDTEDKLNQTIGGYEMAVPSAPESSAPTSEGDDIAVEINKSIPDPDRSANDAKPVQTVEPVRHNSEAPVELKRLPAQRVTINITEPFNGNPRQVYTQLFDDIQLSQELMLAAAENLPIEKSNAVHSTYGRMLNRIVSTGNQVVNQLPSTLDPWLLADLGMNGFNVLTNNELKIRRYMDEQGRTQKVQLIDQDGNRRIFSSN